MFPWVLSTTTARATATERAGKMFAVLGGALAADVYALRGRQRARVVNGIPIVFGLFYLTIS